MPMQGNVIRKNFDFVVVGGGLTGVCAAMAAARHGARVALIHDRPVLGGNASSEIRMHVCGATANMKKPDLTEGGILHELMLSNKRVNDSYQFSIWDAVLFDAVKREPNLTVYLNTTMFGVRAETGIVRELEAYQMTTERHLYITARFFADCTGNGTLAAFAGAAFRTGSEAKGEFGETHAPEKANNDRMGNTLLFKAADRGHPVPFVPPVDVMHFTEEQLKYRKHSLEIPKEILETTTEEERRMLYDGYAQDYGYWWIEIVGEKEDIIEEYEEIRDQLVRAVYGVWDHIKNGGDHGAENFELTWVGMLPGVRESRRVECDYMLCETDLLENHRFDDAVAYGGWHIDNHVGLFQFDRIPSFVYEVPGSYDIPYRSYCVKGFQNLFVGGRCMGASKLAMASTRVMGTCAIGGQAIGTAAALLVSQQSKNVREIDMAALQKTLLKDDCYLPGRLNTDAADLARTAAVAATSAQSEYEAENVINGVSRREGGESNAWRSNGFSKDGETLTLSLAEEAPVAEVQLTFDSNFDLEKKITLSSRRQKQQVAGVPQELVRDFDVILSRNGAVAAVRQVRGNFQRLCRVTFDGTECDTVAVRVLATNGAADARIFEVRAYAK